MKRLSLPMVVKMAPNRSKPARSVEEEEKNGRKGNFSPEENKMLLDCIIDFKSVIIGKLSPTLTNRKKNDAWQLIANRVTEVARPEDVGFGGRTVAAVRQKFHDLKKKYRDDQGKRKKTGHGGVPPGPYDSLIEIIIGKDSDTIDGFREQDDSEIFRPDQSASAASAVVRQDTDHSSEDDSEIFRPDQSASASSAVVRQDTHHSSECNRVHQQHPCIMISNGVHQQHPPTTVSTDSSFERPSTCTFSIPDTLPHEGMNVIVNHSHDSDEQGGPITNSMQTPERLASQSTPPARCSSARKRPSETRRSTLAKRPRQLDLGENSTIEQYYQLLIEKEKRDAEREQEDRERQMKRDRLEEERHNQLMEVGRMKLRFLAVNAEVAELKKQKLQAELNNK